MELPIDDNNKAVQLSPPREPFAVTYNDSVSTSSVEIVLDSHTTLVEVQSSGADVFLAWGGADGSTVNFDEYVQDGHVRHYLVPSGATVVNFVTPSGTAKLVLIEK